MQPYEELERKWAEFNGLNPAGMVACASGTAALHLSFEALQLPPGSQVITSDFNMVAVPRAVVLAGLIPVFVDCDNRMLMDFDLLPKNPPYPRALVATHVYGRRCPMEWFDGLESDERTRPENRCYVVEDLAEAHGVRPSKHADAACWSFYRNKIVAGEEGGAVWFRNRTHADLARQLRCLGFTAAHDFDHVPRGHNYRMSNLHAAAVLDSLEWATGTGRHSSITLRREIESWYDEHCPAQYRMPRRDAPWVYDFRVRMTEEKQNELVRTLNEAGIAARHAFKPMHRQREFVANAGYAATMRMTRPWNSTIASREVVYLPIQPGVTTREDCRRAFDVVEKVLK